MPFGFSLSHKIEKYNNPCDLNIAKCERDIKIFALQFLLFHCVVNVLLDMVPINTKDYLYWFEVT